MPTASQSSSSPQCQICFEVLHNQTPEQLQAHYEIHFTPEPPPVIASPKPIIASPKPMFLGKNLDDKEPFWYPTLQTTPPPNYTPGLISVLRKALIKSHEKGLTRRAALCYDQTVLIVRDWDVSWGCGYRNFLMACAALMVQPFQPTYFPLLDDPLPPGVRNLQRMIEAAWKKGYDAEGAAQLKRKLLGTSQWIGTADLYVAFTSRGIPYALSTSSDVICSPIQSTVLIDFDIDEAKGIAVVTDWIVNYFTPRETSRSDTINEALRGASPVITTNKMPLILQHNGHSRTIVGYEILKSGAVDLLTFDPSMRPRKSLRTAALSSLNLSFAPSPSIIASLMKKRKLDTSPLSAKKRPRNDTDVDAIVISDSEDDLPSTMPSKLPAKEFACENVLDLITTLKFFRLDPKKLRKKKHYQILYFTLEEPLDESERLRRKVVTSTKIQ